MHSHLLDTYSHLDSPLRRIPATAKAVGALVVVVCLVAIPPSPLFFCLVGFMLVMLAAASRIPGIHRAIGYAVGIGLRPEHVPGKAWARPRCPRLATAVFAGIGIAAVAAAFSWAAWKACRRASAQ